MGCKGKLNISCYLELFSGSLQENLSFLEKSNAAFLKCDSYHSCQIRNWANRPDLIRALDPWEISSCLEI